MMRTKVELWKMYAQSQSDMNKNKKHQGHLRRGQWN